MSPRSHSCSTAIAVNVLVMDPMRNTVSSVTGVRRRDVGEPVPVEMAKAPVADHADRQADSGVTAGDHREPALRPGRCLSGRRSHWVSTSGVTGTRAWAAAGLSIARSETPSP